MKTNQFVQVRNNHVVTTSLQIAQTFGKQHKDVLRDIRRLECSPQFIGRNFALYHYISKLNENVSRKLPMYYITRDGFTFLVMGFTGKVAAKFKEDYIDAFNTMEKTLKTDAVPRKTLIEAQKQIAFWKDTAQSSIEANRVLSGVLVELTNKQNSSSELKPQKFYILTPKYYDCAVRAFAEWLDCENKGFFAPYIRDERLTEKLEATRLLYCDLDRRAPFGVRPNKESEVANA